MFIYFSSSFSVQNLKHRSVIHYGHVFDYSTNSAGSAAEPIPSFIDVLIDKLVEDKHTSCRPDQVCIFKYNRFYIPGYSQYLFSGTRYSIAL